MRGILSPFAFGFGGQVRPTINAMIARLLTLVMMALAAAAAPAPPRVEHLAVPEGGLQPQAAIDARGTIHLIYYKGPAAGGDLYYVRRGANDAAFSAPIRVNSDAGSAIAAGAVRGGRLALGRTGWIHIAWNAAHAVERNGEPVTPMWYARLAPGARAFEPQRAIGDHTTYLDGGGTVAADPKGRVYIVWHARGATDGETHRQMRLAASTDDGAHFAADMVLANPGGACSCCSVQALVDTSGRLQIIYRSAGDGIHRDAMWMTAGPSGASSPVTLQPWQLPACPMTTFAIAEGQGALAGAWMIDQQIYTATLNPEARTASAPSPMSGTAPRNHPAIAINRNGDRLVAWIEGANRSRDGRVAWELRDASGKTIASQADAGVVPPLTLVAPIARSDGSFVLIY
jgi:hypothetical protein